MSGKHIFFYHSDCENSKKLLSKIHGTHLQPSFIYINILQAQRIPPNMKGVPAILPAFQPETSLLQGTHAFRWVESALSHAGGERTIMRTHPDPHGPINPRDLDTPTGEAAAMSGSGGGAMSGSGMMGGGGGGRAIDYEPDPTHRPVVIDSGGPRAKVTDDLVLGNSPYEMGGVGYSDKYSFIDNSTAMAHRYSYVNGFTGPGKVGEMVTKEPGDALRDTKGLTMKAKQIETDLKRLQQERDSIPNGIRRVG